LPGLLAVLQAQACFKLLDMVGLAFYDIAIGLALQLQIPYGPLELGRLSPGELGRTAERVYSNRGQLNHGDALLRGVKLAVLPAASEVRVVYRLL